MIEDNTQIDNNNDFDILPNLPPWQQMALLELKHPEYREIHQRLFDKLTTLVNERNTTND